MTSLISIHDVIAHAHTEWLHIIHVSTALIAPYHYTFRGAYDILRGPISILQGSYDILRGPRSILQDSYDILRGPISILQGSYDILRDWHDILRHGIPSGHAFRDMVYGFLNMVQFFPAIINTPNVHNKGITGHGKYLPGYCKWLIMHRK
jgi:hypothetical protein